MDLRQRSWKWYLLEEKWISDRGLGNGICWRRSGYQTEVFEMGEWYLLEEKWISDRGGGVVFAGRGVDPS